MDGFTEKKWFVYLTDHHEGPFSLAELRAKIVQSQVTTANYVWAEGLTDWKPMTEIPEFEPLLTESSSEAVGGGTVMFAPEGGTVATSSPALAMAPAPSPAPAPSMEPPEDFISDVEVTGSSLEAPAAVPVGDEHTGDLDPADLKQATLQVAEPIATETPAKATKKAAKAEKAPRKKMSFGLVFFLLLLFVGGGGGVAYLTGKLDPVLELPAVRAATRAVGDLAQPYLLKVIDKYPALGGWLSPIPSLDDVEPEDYEALKAAAQQKLTDGPRLAVAASVADPFAPFFYVASNLPDGTGIDFYVEGIPDTLLNREAFHGKSQATLDRKLGKSGVVKFTDGKPLPRGEYVIYATESPQQPGATKAILAALPPATAKTADVLPKELKLLVSKAVFLGGQKDATYASRLKEYHDKLRAKASGELAEVKQFSATLESQLTSTTGKFGSLKGLIRGGRPSFAAKKAWNDFNAQWDKLEDGLRQSFAKWNDASLATDYFYGMIYALVKSTGDSIDKLQKIHTDYFNGAMDAKTFEIQRGAALSVAQGAVTALKNKINQAEGLAPTPNGMPRREGL